MITKVLGCLLDSWRRPIASRWVMPMTQECREARKKIRAASQMYLAKTRTKPDEDICDQLNGGLPDDETRLSDDETRLPDDETRLSDDETKKFKYPFENLVLAGGGMKGIAYVGLIKVLEEHGISQQIKRYAGTSAGSIVAASLAIGLNSYDIKEILKVDFNKLLYDAWWMSYITNFIYGYGLNPGIKLYKFLGDLLTLKTGNPDITFEEVYKKYEKELCIVIVNVENSEELYCHVKTTPEMPIRLAVRMSMSIPWIFTPVAITLNDTTSHFVDGGVYVRYPIKCYDGWYLSMNRDDEFHKKTLQEIQDIHNRFKIKSQQKTTIGAVVFSQHENELYSKRSLPKTKLASAHSNMSNATKDVEKMTEAMEELLKILARKEADEITKDEFKTAFNDKSFKEKDKKVLFGEEYDADTAFTAVDKNGDEKITYTELVSWVGSTGILAFDTFNNHKRLNTTNFRKYFGSMISGLSSYAGKVSVHDSDVDRTIVISSWYIKTTDFDLEDKDKDFLIEEGEGATRQFLKNYVGKGEQLSEEETKERDNKVPTCASEENIARKLGI